MKAPDKVQRLVEVFDRNLEAYKRSGYKEANVRSEFIDPFFEALGWDVYNQQGYAEAYKDVITEDAIKVGGATKAPDYCFRIGGARKFFIEAKKPSVDIKGDISPAYQLRRYAWSAGLPLSILTDFEEFAVYDCRLRPQLKDKSGHGRVIYLTYHDYLEKWEEIADVFSKQAVLEGRFDKFVESKKKRSTQEVDVEFLKEIEDWRNLLARNLALRNPGLGIRELNFAVQRTIDRIIFLRICEDRGIETYGRLQALANGKEIYRRLQKLYLLADDKYNSGLFHFRREKDTATPPDELTLDLKIDDKVLKDIFKRLYYPESPYEFSVLGAEILGHIYEQFLGKVIKLTKGHQAKVEEKPEVRKAGGVYYTPTYIVDYIVKNTVGKLCEGKTPKQIEKLRILDPACGSGSFLIGAYNSLHDYHRDWYLENLIPAKGKDKYISKAALKKYVPGKNPEMPIYQGKGGQWYLTTREKKRILLNNIYGVDIDSQAVEVTKLSLLLKVLENENQDSLERQMKLWRERALPDLGNNIKCGNSLIGPDFYDNQQLTLLEDEEQTRINAFDWPTEFPDIMQSGGFDSVIGNPPWGAAFNDSEHLYLVNHYDSVPKKTKDSYLYFVFKAISLLHSSGYLGFIIPNTWLLINNAEAIRRDLLTLNIQEIIDHGDGVFKKATAECTTIILTKNIDTKGSCRAIRLRKQTKIIDHIVFKSLWLKNDYSRIILDMDEETQRLLTKIKSVSEPFEKTSSIIWGIKPYQVGYGTPPQTRKMVDARIYHSTQQQGKAWKPLLVGSNVDRYRLTFAGDLFIKYGKWLMYPSNEIFMRNPKILMRQTSDILRTCYDDKGYYCQNSVFIIHSTAVDLKYLLGLLNSKLLGFAYKLGNPQTKKVFAEIKPSVIKKLPILINHNKQANHDKIIERVNSILDLNKKLPKAKTPIEKIQLERQIKATDRQIDQLVYELYGLTDKEIEIVEGDER